MLILDSRKSTAALLRGDDIGRFVASKAAWAILGKV
jgi:hypothetical protein